MKLIISLVFIILFFSSNQISADNHSLKLDDLKLDLDKKEFLKKNNLDLPVQKDFDISKYRGLIVIVGIIIFFIFFKDQTGFREEEEKHIKKEKNKNQARIDAFVKKSNKNNIDKEIEDEFNYDEEDSWQADESEGSFKDSLKIKVEEQIHENKPLLAIMGFGSFNLEDKYYKLINKDNSEAKFTVYVFDVTNDEEIALQGLEDPYKDDNYLLSQNRTMEVKHGYGYFEWTPMYFFPKTLVVPPYRGERKLKFILYMSSKKAQFENGKIKSEKDLYYSTEFILNYSFEDPGYLEEGKYEDEVNEKIVQLGLAVAYSEKKINQKGVEAIKSWINQKVILKNYFLENTEQEKENKIKYSFLLKNTYQLLKKNKLSLSEIVKELNFKSSASKRYEAMNLLLNIAGSDDRLSAEEDKLLNQTARALELNMDRFQQMKTSTIANIDTIDENSQENEDTIFNFSPNMTNEEKCKKLREEYTRWNRQTNNSNEKIRNQAKKMVELTAKLRKKYNC